MPTQDNDRLKKYKLVSRIEIGVFLIISLSPVFLGNENALNNSWFIFIVCLTLCTISGYIAILYNKLPKKEKI